MLEVLSNKTFRHLFGAQVVALLGSGLATVALGLLAYDLAGGNAALVLGTVFAIKMLANVMVAPLAGALADQVPRRAALVGLDIARAAVAVALPFVTEAWHVYALIAVLQIASASFTPLFQATIPDILPDERRYTNALSLSRLAYDLEMVLAPLLAAVLLTIVSFDLLFLGTSAGFVASAVLIVSVALPQAVRSETTLPFRTRSVRGLRMYLATPRLRALLALNLAVAAAGSMVLVNTVVLVQGPLGRDATDVALSMAAFGVGSMGVALLLPRILDRLPERDLMTCAAALSGGALLGLSIWVAWSGLTWSGLLVAWVLVGMGYSCVLTPSGRLLRRSSHPEDRPSIFAAQFALSHACWLIAYPLAGGLQTWGGTAAALAVLGAVAVTASGLARGIWPDPDRESLHHAHPELPKDHPHLREHGSHAHAIVIDDLHPVWPKQSRDSANTE